MATVMWLSISPALIHSAWHLQVPLYERIALYSVADVAVVTATRDGMNLVPYEFMVCRQGMEVRRRSVAQTQMSDNKKLAVLDLHPGALHIDPHTDTCTHIHAGY